MKFSEKKFEKAQNIAHPFFWESDCPSTKKRVQEYIEKNVNRNLSVADYVAIICYKLCS